MTTGRRIAVLVSNDLTFDQRVRKTCDTLRRAGHEPVLIGRRMKRDDAASIDRPYPTRRLWLGVNSGPLFYGVQQIRLWGAHRRLHRAGGVQPDWANDLDTLGPAVWAARRFGWAIAYDSHEWFTEAEGLNGQRIKKAVAGLGRRCFRGINRMLTVNSQLLKPTAAMASRWTWYPMCRSGLSRLSPCRGRIWAGPRTRWSC